METTTINSAAAAEGWQEAVAASAAQTGESISPHDRQLQERSSIPQNVVLLTAEYSDKTAAWQLVNWEECGIAHSVQG